MPKPETRGSKPTRKDWPKLEARARELEEQGKGGREAAKEAASEFPGVNPSTLRNRVLIAKQGPVREQVAQAEAERQADERLAESRRREQLRRLANLKAAMEPPASEYFRAKPRGGPK